MSGWLFQTDFLIDVIFHQWTSVPTWPTRTCMCSKHCCCCCLIIKYQTSVNNILINIHEQHWSGDSVAIVGVSIGRGGRVPDTTNGTELPRCEMSDWLFQTDLLIGRQWRQCCEGYDSLLSARISHLSCQTCFNLFYSLFKFVGIVIGFYCQFRLKDHLWMNLKSGQKIANCHHIIIIWWNF